MPQTISKLVSFRVDPVLDELILQKAKEQRRPISNYIKTVLVEDPDVTDYLLSTTANRDRLNQSIEDVKKDKVKTFQTSKEIIDYVQTITD